ncbi:SMAD/FHA domain superfamily [Sesbania bispinosa]|nr:SMAD/FHA domain superfamily [Sesbania bispinosa]
MEEPPSLRLLILQGPRQGETLYFKPQSAIRIGRVLRGNTLPIKDPGISSNHLSILTESGKWVLRDLHSSNGTVLDGSKVTPHTPFQLNDGSTIVIGERTSILVTFLHQPHAIQTGTVPEPGSETDEPAAPVAKPGRVRRGIGNSDAPEQKVDEPKNTRVTRNSKNNKRGAIGDSPQDSSLLCGMENVERKKRRGGAKRKKLHEQCGVHLPKQILDATEEMFDSMRQKAERLREYIIMQKDYKVEMPFE